MKINIKMKKKKKNLKQKFHDDKKAPQSKCKFRVSLVTSRSRCSISYIALILDLPLISV